MGALELANSLALLLGRVGELALEPT